MPNSRAVVVSGSKFSMLLLHLQQCLLVSESNFAELRLPPSPLAVFIAAQMLTLQDLTKPLRNLHFETLALKNLKRKLDFFKCGFYNSKTRDAARAVDKLMTAQGTVLHCHLKQRNDTQRDIGHDAQHLLKIAGWRGGSLETGGSPPIEDTPYCSNVVRLAKAVSF
eukprot:716899-Amphidinium_carterae.1